MILSLTVVENAKKGYRRSEVYLSFTPGGASGTVGEQGHGEIVEEGGCRNQLVLA